MSVARQMAIVTGTSSGIGAALAKALLEQDWFVLGLARRQVDFGNPNYHHLETDLADLVTLDTSVLPQVKQILGQPDWDRVALVNNAADIGSLCRVDAYKSRELIKVYAVNTVAPARLMGTVSKLVPVTTWLRIINVSTGAAGRGVPGLGDYAGSKAALRLTGMTLASEFEQEQRTRAAILSYEPGVVDTAMQAQARAGSDDFPSWEMFNGFHANGVLQPADAVIGKMLTFLNSFEGPAFREERYTP